MKTLRRLSNKKLDALEDRIKRRPFWRGYSGMLWKIMNERLRRLGL